jgi:hypothetical protein
VGVSSPLSSCIRDETDLVSALFSCMVHNKVNKSLDKPQFDCKDIGDGYDTPGTELVADE